MNSIDKKNYIITALFLMLLTYLFFRFNTNIYFDDAYFYFRYAKNLLSLDIYKFNPTDPPVWGASSLLWPLGLALTKVFFSSTIEQANLILSAFFTITAYFTLINKRSLNIFGVVFLFAFILLNFRFILILTQGLESPLTIFLLSISIFLILNKSKEIYYYLVPILLAIHKIDLIPVSMILICVLVAQQKCTIKGSFFILLTVFLIYGSLYFYFGTLGPNTLYTKFILSSSSNLPRSWYLSNTIFLLGNKYITVVGFIASILCLFKMKFKVLPIIVFSYLSMAALIGIYSIKIPSEPFLWYTIPVTFINIYIAAYSCGNIIQCYFVDKNYKILTVAVAISSSIFIFYYASTGYRISYEDVSFFRNYLSKVEYDRTSAGRWVRDNYPTGATIASGYGAPFYFSNLYAFDWTYLNAPRDELFRKPRELYIEKHRPDIIIECPFGSGVRGENFNPPFPGYHNTKVFNTSQKNNFMDFFCMVMERDDFKKSAN